MLMASSLTTLPTELLFRIIDWLDFNDKLKWSSVNHELRELLAAKEFYSLKADMQNKESLIAVYAILENYRKHVRHLRFECHTGPKYDDYGETSQPESDTEDEQQGAEEKKRREKSMGAWRMVRALLDSKQSPGIEEMTLCFYCAPESEPCDPDEVPMLKHSKNSYWVQRFNHFWETGSEEEVKTAEDTEP